MILRGVFRPLLLALWAGAGGAHAGGFPTEPSPAVVEPAPPPLPAEPDRWLPFRIFDWRDGLTPYATMVQPDQDGYLWASTPGGLRVYNGRTWRSVPAPPMTGARNLLPVSDGTVWIGTETQGACRLRSGTCTWYDERNGLLSAWVSAFLQGPGGTLWIGTMKGLSRCHQDICRPVPATLGLPVRAVLPTRSETGQPALWLGTRRGLVRLDGIEGPEPTLAPLLFDHRNALPDDSVLSLAEGGKTAGERSLWVGTEKGLARFWRGVWTRYDAAAGFPGSKITALLPGRWAGRPVTWVGSLDAGLLRIEADGRWRAFGINTGLPSNHVVGLLTLETDRVDPVLWIATMNGVARLEQDRWHFFRPESGLPEDMVVRTGEATFPDGLRTYWVTTVNGLYRLTRSGWERYAPIPETVFAVASTGAGSNADFWIAAMDGVHRWSRGRRELFTSRNSPLPHDWAFSLTPVPSEAGELWSQSSQGLARWANGRWTAYPPESRDLPGKAPAPVVWSPSGRGGVVVWTGTSAGVSRFAQERWTSFQVPCLPGSAVLAVQPMTDAQGDGWLWLGMAGGLARLPLRGGDVVPGVCQALTERTRPALLPARIDQLQIDRRGRVYLCTSQGVTRLSLPAGSETLDQGHLETFDAEDGLPSFQTSAVSFRDGLGRIWVGGASGLSVFDPDLEPRQPPPRRPSPLRIERIQVNGLEHLPGSQLVLRGRERRMEIDYALLSYRREHATRFQTQLLGLEEKPSPWAREARIAYDRLPPGDYTFRVWGRDGDGVVSDPAELGFAVLPPPWLTSWAFALYALSLIGLVYGAVRLRVRTLALRAAHLEALVAERTRDLAEANHRLELASFTDPLTGLHNRRFLTSTIRPDVVQAVRNHRDPAGDPHHRDLVVYLLDLDHFKRLNDRAGHDAGDAVLVEVARRLRSVVRASDLVVRWGGEEILVVSRWTDREKGTLLAGRLLEAIGGEPFRTGVDRTSTVTCSLGWAPFPWSAEDPDAILFEETLSLADRALFLAKREGRNRGVGALPGTARAEEVAERILRENAPLYSLEGLQVELVWTPGSPVAADDRTSTLRSAEGSPLTPSGSDAMLRGPI